MALPCTRPGRRYNALNVSGKVTITTAMNVNSVTLRSALCLAAALWAGIPAQPVHAQSQQRWMAPAVNLLRFDSLIHETASRYRVDPALVMAVIHAESFFNPRAVSHKGAGGLMQLMPATARRYGVTDLHDPRQNVDAGVRYLRDLMERYSGNLLFVLAAYNAGEEAVDRYAGIPPYRETRRYVRKVLQYHQYYQDWP